MYVDGKAIVAETCPANHADYDVDISSHDFKLIVTEAPGDPKGPYKITEVFGYFQPEGLGEEEWTDEIAETDTLEVPKGSPIANIAHEVADDASGDAAHVAGEVLRRAVAACSCSYTGDECPALGRLGLLGAMETAISKPL